MANLYETIEALCVNHKITRSKMCRDLGWSPSVMGELKSGRTKMLSANKLEKIANYFDVPVSALLNENEPTPKIGSELTLGTDYMKLNKANKKKVDEMIEMLLKLQSLDE